MGAAVVIYVVAVQLRYACMRFLARGRKGDGGSMDIRDGLTRTVHAAVSRTNL